MSSGERIGGDGGGGSSEWDTLTTGDIEKLASSTEEPNYDEFVKRELPKLEKDFEGVTVEKEPVESRTVDGFGEEVFHKRSEVGDEPKLGGALYDGDYTPRPSRYYRNNESTPEPTPAVREYTEQEKAERQRILDKIADIMSEESSTEQQ